MLAYTRICMHIRVYVQIRAYTPICSHIRVYVCIYAHMHTYPFGQPSETTASLHRPSLGHRPARATPMIFDLGHLTAPSCTPYPRWAGIGGFAFSIFQIMTKGRLFGQGGGAARPNARPQTTSIKKRSLSVGVIRCAFCERKRAREAVPKASGEEITSSLSGAQAP